MADSVIDRATLDDLVETLGGDMEFLVDLMDTFFTDANGLFEQMNDGIANADSVIFQRAAHSLKSNAASFGAMPLSEMAKHMEEMGKNGDLKDAAIKIGEAFAEFAKVKAALEAIRDEAK